MSYNPSSDLTYLRSRIAALEEELRCVSADRDSWRESSQRKNIALAEARNRIANIGTRLYMITGNGDCGIDANLDTLEHALADSVRLNKVDYFCRSCVRGTDVPKWIVEAADETVPNIRAAIDAMEAAR